MQLKALSPNTYEFSNDTGKYRVDYFYLDTVYRADPGFREALRALVEKAHAKVPPAYDVSSIYVYRKTEMLNQDFSGNADALRGVYDNDLVSYSRWNQQAIDVFYLIDEGNVVFDLISNEAVSVPWEFD
ncbi:MAG: hypothetical protein KZQ95_06920 [Candidatus Thiodiazotropha sp. (ex Epidulcina cf. delphinae)]|nr:hypothetical protein [Candidatus Thiodiazotropha sp. (ex Epidulcina cf. delphinae)]